MRRTLISLLVFGCALGYGADPAAGQRVPSDSAKRQAIRRLLAIQQTDSIMLAGMQEGIAGQPVDPSLPQGFFDSLRTRAAREINLFVERLVPLYDSLYTAGEIQDLVGFYQSKLGRRLIDTQPRLASAMMTLAQQWGMELAGKVLVDLSRQPLKRP